jgi:hypothetical protein
MTHKHSAGRGEYAQVKAIVWHNSKPCVRLTYGSEVRLGADSLSTDELVDLLGFCAGADEVVARESPR